MASGTSGKALACSVLDPAPTLVTGTLTLLAFAAKVAVAGTVTAAVLLDEDHQRDEALLVPRRGEQRLDLLERQRAELAYDAAEVRNRQAEEAVTHYRTLFAHPSVEAITWWGLNDGGWLKAPSGLVRINQSPKPAYEALHRLIKGEWWMMPTTLTSDASGQIRFTGTLGEYTLSCDGRSTTFQLASAGEVRSSVRT